MLKEVASIRGEDVADTRRAAAAAYAELYGVTL